MRMRFLVVFAGLPSEKEQILFRVARIHTACFLQLAGCRQDTTMRPHGT